MVQMRSSRYWDKRAIARLTEAERNSDWHFREIKVLYEEAEKDILTILENASEIDFDFTNVIVLNHYDWLKNSFDEEVSQRATIALEKLINNAKERNIIIIVVDRDTSLYETIPDYDAILCFHLTSEDLSRHILGVPGAEKLKDKGDSLYLNKKTGEI